jgi:hypothetical protein
MAYGHFNSTTETEKDKAGGRALYTHSKVLSAKVRDWKGGREGRKILPLQPHPGKEKGVKGKGERETERRKNGREEEGSSLVSSATFKRSHSATEKGKKRGGRGRERERGGKGGRVRHACIQDAPRSDESHELAFRHLPRSTMKGVGVRGGKD